MTLLFSGVNLEIEERAQKAIDTYFSSQIIVPSPWTDSAKKKPFVLPATPGELKHCLVLSGNFLTEF